MADRECAICGMEAHPAWTQPLPFDWEFYLIAERDLDPTLEDLMIPLCPACGPDVNRLVSKYEHLSQYTPCERDHLRDQRNELLDDLSLEVLYDR